MSQIPKNENLAELVPKKRNRRKFRSTRKESKKFYDRPIYEDSTIFERDVLAFTRKYFGVGRGIKISRNTSLGTLAGLNWHKVASFTFAVERKWNVVFLDSAKENELNSLCFDCGPKLNSTVGLFMTVLKKAIRRAAVKKQYKTITANREKVLNMHSS